tara:strand:+ start:710 stop:1180 length:471 start_codon:yes stop_codon:yes gene_type:complete
MGLMNKNVYLLCAAIASAVMTGCTSLSIGEDEYSCPGMPEGVRCMSATDVYNATDNGKVPRPMKSADKDEAEAEGVSVKTQVVEDVVVNKYVTPRLPDKPIPIRTPAEVMKIWIAPWEDLDGDLNAPGYVYTEIEPRRWVIGVGHENENHVFQPLN